MPLWSPLLSNVSDRVLGDAEHLRQRDAGIDEHPVERKLDQRASRQVPLPELPATARAPS